MEGDILSGFEYRQSPAVVRREIKGFNFVALADFFDDLKFAATIPKQIDLLDFLASKPCRLDLLAQPYSSQQALFAFEGKPAECSVT